MNDHTVLIPPSKEQESAEVNEPGDIAIDATIMVASSEEGSKTEVDLSRKKQDKTVAISAIRKAEFSTDDQSKGVSIGDCLKQRFELLDVLGIGGMGVVYRARDRRQKELGDKQPYLALKVLNDQLSDHEAALVALQQECKKSQKLAHPNIVNVYDFDRDGDVVYLTMELLHGESLDQILLRDNHRARTYEEILPWVTSIADALVYAHDNHIVHSDLKPSNIFITDAGNLKIFDFGIARASHSSGQANNDLAALTPAYASLGMLTKQPPKASDDLYAFAVVVYLLLSGKHPYGRKSADEVVRLGLTPKRPKSVPDAPWRMLQQALDPSRCEQLDVESFRTGFVPKPRAISRSLAIALGAIAIVIFGFMLNLGANYFEDQRNADALMTGSIDTVKQTLDSLSSYDAQRRLDLLSSHRDLFIENFIRLVDQKIADEHYYQALNFSQFMLTVYPDSKRILEATEVVSNQLTAKQQAYVDRINSIEARLVGFSDEHVKQWFYSLDRLKRINPKHELLNEDRLLASVSIALHGLLFSGRVGTAELLLDHLSNEIVHREELELMRKKVARYAQGSKTFAFYPANDVAPSALISEKMETLLNAVARNNELSPQLTSEIVRELKGIESEYAEAVIWALKRHIALKSEEKGALRKDWKLYQRALQ